MFADRWFDQEDFYVFVRKNEVAAEGGWFRVAVGYFGYGGQSLDECDDQLFVANEYLFGEIETRVTVVFLAAFVKKAFGDGFGDEKIVDDVALMSVPYFWRVLESWLEKVNTWN